MHFPRRLKKVKVLTVKLRYSEQRVKYLLSEKATMKSCIADINGLLSDIIEIHDSMITITVKKHLAEKFMSGFSMLNRLEGVLEFGSIP